MTSANPSHDSRDHVVHVIGSLQIGGAEKMLVNFIKAADQDRFRYTILCLSSRGEMADEVLGAGVNLEVRKVRFRTFFRDIGNLAHWFRTQRVRVIHSHMFYASLCSRIAGLRAGVPVLVTTEHGKEPWKKWWQIKLDNFLSRKTYYHIAVSVDVRNIRIRRDGVSPDRITVIPNGVPIPQKTNESRVRKGLRAEFGFEDDTFVIGTVGRVIGAKDYPLLLEALVLVRKSIPHSHWLQVGDGPDREKIMGLAEKLGLSSSVTFAGRRSDVGDLLEAMDVWVMSSAREGLPVALLEAMAAGKPIVATDVGGIPDAVDNDISALLVPAGDAEALAGCIVKIREDVQLAGKLASAARERAMRKFGIEAVTRKIENIYLQGLSDRPL